MELEQIFYSSYTISYKLAMLATVATV